MQRALAEPVVLPRYEDVTFGPTNSDVLRADRRTGDHMHMFIEGPDSLTTLLPLR